MSGAIGIGAIGQFVIGGTGTPTPPPTPPPTPQPTPTPPSGPTFWAAPPPTRILSWLQMCLEADPNFHQLSLRPWVYEFSNGRLFIDALPLYGSYGIVDDFGTPITDDFGTQIQSDQGTGAASPTGGFPFGVGAFGETGF